MSSYGHTSVRAVCRRHAAKGWFNQYDVRERLFALIGVLERVAIPLTEDRIPYELIGGGAVMVQVQRVEQSAVRNTKCVDIMISRADLEGAKESVKRQGFAFRHVAGVDMLLPPGKTKAMAW